MKIPVSSSFFPPSSPGGLPNSWISAHSTPLQSTGRKSDSNTFLFGIGRRPQIGIKNLLKPLEEKSM